MSSYMDNLLYAYKIYKKAESVYSAVSTVLYVTLLVYHMKDKFQTQSKVDDDFHIVTEDDFDVLRDDEQYIKRIQTGEEPIEDYF